MSEPLYDLSTPALISANRANLFDYHRFLGRSPQAEWHDSSELEWVLTGVPHPFLNNVLRARLAPGTAGDVLARTLSGFSAKRVTHLSWWTDPDTQPPDLPDRLLAHGFAYTDGAPGMAADLSTLNEAGAAPGDLTIHTVGDTKALKVWIHTFVAAFGVPEGEGVSFALYAGLGYDLPLRSYTGCLRGEPVATAQLFLGAGVAGIYCVGTLPRARRQGIGAALTLAALLDARDMGYRVGILQSSPLGVHVYERLGFRELCRMSHFYWAHPIVTQSAS